MKKFYFLGIISMAICMIGCSGGSGNVSLKTAYDSASYALGVNTGASFKEMSYPGGELDIDLIIAGFKNAIKEKEKNMTAEDTYEYLNTYFSTTIYKYKIQEEKIFLADNAKKEGVKVTDSGLQYRVIEEGIGDGPALRDTVRVKYTGKFIDGSVFDSSEDDVASFAVNEVIPGWTEAVQLMNVGSKYEIWLPYNLAYGEAGAGSFIEPYSTLCFDVELVDIIRVE